MAHNRYIPILLVLMICLTTFQVIGQTPKYERAHEEQYQRNIKKQRIQGVYIPVDLEDAFEELKALSSKESIRKFQMASEDVVARRLHFGLGRWMIYNWNFYEGSRFSHYLKGLGITHPDDMAQFVIISFHRSLNDKDLDIEQLADTYRVKRTTEQKNRIEQAKVLQETRKKRPPEKTGGQ